MTGCVREAEVEAALDGRLDPESVRGVMRHVEGCLRCREARREFEGLSRLARELPAVTPDTVASRRMRGALMGVALMGAPERRARGAMGGWAIAAGLCLVALSGVGAWAASRAIGRRAGEVTTVTRVRVATTRPTVVQRVRVETIAPVAVVTVVPSSVAAPPRTGTATDVGAFFREGSLAYAQGDHVSAERGLGSFLAGARSGDPRREDARYLRVLSLDRLGRVDALNREAGTYLREFQGGVRRAEVVVTAARALAANGRCDEARRIGRAMPEGAHERHRSALARVLECGGRD